ncbi:MAG: PaaI family thioesterase [bacterium]|jgi:uncharacterized protein (TIGR00369 family)
MSGESQQPIDLGERARSIPFLRHLGLELVEYQPGRARMRFCIRPEHLNYLGTLHGGMTCSLIDSVAYFALRPLLSADHPFPTLELKVNFLRPVKEGMVLAEAEALHAGKRVMVAQVKVMDGEGRLCAFGTVSCLVAPLK